MTLTPAELLRIERIHAETSDPLERLRRRWNLAASDAGFKGSEYVDEPEAVFGRVRESAGPRGDVALAGGEGRADAPTPRRAGRGSWPRPTTPTSPTRPRPPTRCSVIVLVGDRGRAQRPVPRKDRRGLMGGWVVVGTALVVVIVSWVYLSGLETWESFANRGASAEGREDATVRVLRPGEYPYDRDHER